MRHPELNALTAAAHAAADAARAPTLARFRAPDLGVDDKSAGAAYDPVTAADREAETAIRAVLAEQRPDDAVVGEEHPDAAGRSGVTWVIDPIDGTRAYVAGAPTWGVLIAAADAHGVILGVMDQPFTGERWSATDGGAGVWTRGDARRALRARARAALAEATVLTTFPEVGAPAERAAFQRVAAQARLTRYGLDCTGYGLVALGCADLVIEAGLQRYDIAALIPIVRAAGGVVTDWRGGDCGDGGRVLAAGDPRLHAQALALLRDAPAP